MLVKGRLGMRRGEWALWLGLGCIAWLHIGAYHLKVGVRAYRWSVCAVLEVFPQSAGLSIHGFMPRNRSGRKSLKAVYSVQIGSLLAL